MEVVAEKAAVPFNNGRPRIKDAPTTPQTACMHHLSLGITSHALTLAIASRQSDLLDAHAN